MAIGLLVLTALAAAGAGALYQRYLAYDRVAARHLPVDPELVARVDIENVVLFDPVRRHFLPLFDSAFGVAPGLAPRHERLRQRTGLELGRDLREIVVAFGQGPRDWVVVLNGAFPKSGLTAAIAAVLREEGQSLELGAEGLVLPRLGWLGQASDGALVVASSPERLKQSLSASLRFETLGLPVRDAGGLVLRCPWGHEPSESPVAHCRRIAARFHLGEQIEADVSLAFESGAEPLSSQAIAAEIAGLAERVPAASGVRGLLRSATVSTTSATETLLALRWQRAELDQAAAWSAAALARRLGAAP